MEYTREELYVEYLEDLIEEQGGVEKVVLNVGTKDEPVLVKPRGGSDFEDRLVAGGELNVFDGILPEEQARIERFMHRNDAKVAAPPADPPLEEFQDDYTKDGDT